MSEKNKRALLPKDKKTLLKLGGLLLIGLLLVFWSSSWGSTKTKTPASAQINSQVQKDSSFEAELEQILSQIKGVGKVAVCLNYSSLYSKEFVFNESSTEKNQQEQSAERTTVSKDSSSTKTFVTAGTQNEPVIAQEYAPKVMAVLVVAEGAGNISVKEQLFSVTQSLLGLPANNISIVQMK